MNYDRAGWEARGRELFGADKATWRFRCPRCGNVASVERAKSEWPQLKASGWVPEQECVGRYLTGVGCNWAAYGVFHGPDFVSVDGRAEPVPVFAFDAPEPKP